MLCCGRKKDGHKEHPVEMAASPRRQGAGQETGGAPLPGSSSYHHHHQQQQHQHQHQHQQQYHHPQQGHHQTGMHPLSSVATGALGHLHQSPGTGLRSMVVQSDFRKVSGISTEIFRQIETVENDHDATTAAALEAVERRGEMLVRVLDPRNMGRAASEAARSFLAVQDPKHSVHFVEIVKRPGQTLGLYIREGNGIDRSDGVFISRIALESPVYNSGCLRVGDEILAINLVDVTRMSLDDVVIVMSIPRRLVLTTRQRRGPAGAVSPPPPRPEQKPPPVVVLKRGVQPEEPLDDAASNSTSNNGDRPYASPYAQHRFMTTGKPLPGMADLPVHGTFPRVNRDQRDLFREREAGRYPERTLEDAMRHENSESLGQFYTNYRMMEQQRSQYAQPRSGGTLERGQKAAAAAPGDIDSYQPPPPLLPVTEQPKSGSGGSGGGGQHYPFDRPNFGAKTLESLAERVHPFYGLQGGPAAAASQGVGRSSTLGRQPNRAQQQQGPASLGAPGSSMSLMRTPGATTNRLTRSGSDQRLPAVEGGGDYYDYLRAKTHYTTPTPRQQQQQPGLVPRRRTSIDYASDTEASTRSYSRRGGGEASGTWKAPPPLLGLATPLVNPTDSRSNSLPRGGSLAGTRAYGRREVHFEPGAPSPRPGPASANLLDSAEDSDGAVSAPEMSVSQKQKQLQRLNQQLQYAQGILSGAAAAAAASASASSGPLPGNFTSAEYKAWMSRAPSTSAIYESLRQVRDPAAAEPKRSVKLTFSAENLVEKTKQEMAYYSYRSHFTGATTAGLDDSDPLKRADTSDQARSLISQAAAAASSSKTSDPRFKLLDINTTEFVKYRSERPNGSSQAANQQLATNPQTAMTTASVGGASGPGPAPGGGVEEGVSGLLWIHLLAGRGLRSTSSRLEPVRDLYCVLECDRAHKARTVIRSGDVNFDWDETFDLDLVVNRELDFLIYSWDPQLRHRLCFKGSLHLVPLVRESTTHQVALKVEPRGTLYLKLRYTDPRTAFRRTPAARKTPPPLFGVDLETVVGREGGGGGVGGVGVASGLLTGGNGGVPIIVQKCVEEVERRGMDIVGLYRLCGSATKKRILREAFERNPRLVDLSPDSVPDINVITGLLKEYLRELPEPLLTKCLYQMLVDALAVCLPDDPEGNAKLMFSILECLPKGNRTTLFLLMDHLCLVTAQSDRNKMTPQNLAICFGPVLMLHSDDTPNSLEFQKPIGVLKYLLQIWPMKSARAVEAAATASSTLRRIQQQQPPPHQRTASAPGARPPPQQQAPSSVLEFKSSTTLLSSVRQDHPGAASDQEPASHLPSDQAAARSSSSTSYTSNSSSISNSSVISSSAAQVAQAAAQVAQQALSSSDRSATSLTQLHHQAPGRGPVAERRLDLPPLPPRPAPRVVGPANVITRPMGPKPVLAMSDSQPTGPETNRGEADGSPAPLSIDSAAGAESETPSLTSPTSTTSTTSLSSLQHPQQRSSSVMRRYKHQSDDGSPNRNQLGDDDTDRVESDLESPN